jgi:uncharacterized membrane protein SirB2
MARTQYPRVPKTGGRVVRKLITLLIVAGVLVLAVKHPSETAQWLTEAFVVLGRVVEGLATFLQHLPG